MPRPRIDYDKLPNLSEAAALGMTELVWELLEQSPSKRDIDEALDSAYDAKAWVCFDLLLPKATVDGIEVVLLHAANRNQVDLMRRLLPLMSAAPQHRERALLAASRGGACEAIELLLPDTDAKAFDSMCLWHAACGGRERVMALLLPHANPRDHGSRALMLAMQSPRQNQACIDLLLPHSDPVAAYKQAIDEGYITVVERMLDMVGPTEWRAALDSAGDEAAQLLPLTNQAWWNHSIGANPTAQRSRARV